MSAETVTVQNYLKAIHQRCEMSPSGAASTGDLARYLGLTPGSVTAMLQRLAESGLVQYKAHQGVRLSEEGRQLALSVLRRHRLIELLLWRTLGVPWDQVHEEAENLEHAVSDRLVERIDAYLDYPDRDPHGDPIPDASGTMRAVEGQSLDSCPKDTQFVLQRVPHESPDFLRYLSEAGLTVGTTATVAENSPSAGIVTIELGGRRVSLSRELASRMQIRRV